ncbi:MAG: hypothetical protein PHH75_07440 [Candidatus Omnitrophica bacterium]|nr:hypothetical protein [Candidatus Omnitrophota bacterium]MDD5574992.1 hypothetical protein [Candidatus Omnitrophota bacterium]
MSDAVIYGLSLLFLASIVFWAISAYAEMIVYKTLRQISRLIQVILKHHEETAGDGPTDYCIVEGRYKNRSVVCRINRIAARTLWNFKLSLHCHLEPLRSPLRDQEPKAAPRGTLGKSSDAYYPSTSTTCIRSFGPGERISEADILTIFEDLTRAAEMIENQSST